MIFGTKEILNLKSIDLIEEIFEKAIPYLVQNNNFNMRSLRNLVTALLNAITFLLFGVAACMSVLKGMLVTSGRLFPDFQKAELSQD